MLSNQPVLIEGYTADELLALPEDQFSRYVFTDSPLVLRIGTAEVLGQFRLSGARLIVELAQIDGGGEGVLPLLWRLMDRYAKQRKLAEVEWIVHAVDCAKPNLKLRRVLDKKGFVIEDVGGAVLAYHFVNQYPQ